MADPTLDEIEAIKKSAMRAATDNRDEDLFAGPYERFKPKYFYGNKNYPNSKILPNENFNSEIVPQRKELFKNVIWRNIQHITNIYK